MTATEPMEQTFHKAVRFYEKGRLKKARKCLEDIQRRQPDIPDVLHFLGLVALREDRAGDAAAYLETATRLVPQSTELWGLLGSALKKSGRGNEALEAFRKALSINPDAADLHYNMGNTLRDLERPEEAIGCYQEAVSLNPNFVDGYYNLALSQKETGQTEEAISTNQQVLTLRPEDTEAHNNLGNLFYECGRIEEAVAQYRKAIDSSPKFADAYVNLGVALNGLGNQQEALEPIHQALTIDPDHAKALAAIGGFLFEQQQFDEASRYLKQAAEKDTTYECGNVCFFGEDFEARSNPEDFDGLVSTLPALTGTFPADSGDGPVVMTSCDHKYFRKFAPALALSVDQYAPGHDFHLHVINPEPSFDNDIAALRQRLGKTMVTVSAESMPGAGRLQFPVLRFVRLSQLLDMTSRDFLHLDTDSLVHGPLHSVGDIDAGANLSIPIRFDKIPFIYKVLISTLWVRNTSMTRLFMRRYGTYLLHCLSENRLVWALDQAAFYVVYRMMAFAGEDVSLAPLPKGLCDHDFDEGSDVWAAKGDRKKNTVFEQECARLLATGQ